MLAEYGMRVILFMVMAIFTTCSTYGQGTLSINGIVIDKGGSPIPYCNVSVKGTTIASTTNQCGEFELTTHQQQFTIVFNCVYTQDFVTFEKRISAQEIHSKGTILFKLKNHGKIKNKECKKKIDKRLKKITV
jgi:hypothetical protein